MKLVVFAVAVLALLIGCGDVPPPKVLPIITVTAVTYYQGTWSEDAHTVVTGSDGKTRKLYHEHRWPAYPDRDRVPGVGDRIEIDTFLWSFVDDKR